MVSPIRWAVGRRCPHCQHRDSRASREIVRQWREFQWESRERAAATHVRRSFRPDIQLPDVPTIVLDALVTFDVVYLARHGQTQWNQEGRKQGQLDSPLSAAGTRHAENLAHAAATFDVDLVASSPIGRALGTARVCAHALGLAVVVVTELAEVHHGDMAGLTTSEAGALFPGALERRAMDKYQWRFPGGESYTDADLRAGIALDRVARTGARRPLIVSHEMIGRMLRRHLLGSRPIDVLSISQPHHVVLRVDPSSGHVDELPTGAEPACQ